MNRLLMKGALVVLVMLVAGPPVRSAQADDRTDGMRFLSDVPGQIRGLTQYPEALGLNISTTPNPSACRHYQGLARVDGADGTPFFLVTRSGNLPETIPFADIVCDDSPGERYNGNLVVFRMGSRDKNGERLRSNRLEKGVHIDNTPPDYRDVATKYYTVVGGDPDETDPCKRPGLIFREGYIDQDGDGVNNCSLPPAHAYQHPGGMQLIGTTLALATDTPRDLLKECYIGCNIYATNPSLQTVCKAGCDATIDYEPASSPSLIMFFDVSDPEHPAYRSQFVPVGNDGKAMENADGIAVTPLPEGLYLMAVTAGFDGGDPILFFRSTVNDLSSTALSWEYVTKASIPSPGDEESDGLQQLHFLREGSIDGDLYLAGTRGHPVFSDHDRIDLFHVTCQTPDCAPGETIGLTYKYHGQRVTPYPTTGGLAKLANLAAAAGFYESVSGELILYATEHDNDGPNGSVKAAEWRNRDMVRSDSPTLLPSAMAGGTYEVDEGGSVALSGTAKPPLTRAWIELFSDTGYEGRYIVVDFDDYGLDNFDDFSLLEQGPIPIFYPPSLNDMARSWKWYAPVGCSIQAIESPSGLVKTLVGSGAMQEDADLGLVLDDEGKTSVNEQIDAVKFLDNCTSYYATPVSLHWDLDMNGSYETTGTSVTFSAAALDGPSTVTVPVTAQHPAGGSPGYTSTTVNVRNVPPQVTQFNITDSAGNRIGVDVPFVLVGQPVTVNAAFSDPGLPDHQTAALDWGDGTTEDQSAFAAFDEAFGDGTGGVAQTHRYDLDGNYQLILAVTDDDGGVGSGSASVRAVTPEQAVNEVIALLNGKIAGEPNRIIKEILKKALKALIGSPPDPSSNGALNMIMAGNDASAITFLQTAIGWLKVAEGGGADVGLLITLLELVILALSVP